MNERPIGVFDSGFGGLTAVRRLRDLMPSENIIYFGDTSRVPYGNRSRDTILKYARQDTRFLRSFDLKAIVIACGTVSSNCLPQLQAENDIPIIGVVEPAVRRAAALTRNKRVGVAATRATVASGAFARALAALDGDVTVFSHPCPLFVPLVEEGRCRPEDPVIRLVAEEYLLPLREQGVDTLVLGCTHYPLLKALIGGVVGRPVTLVSSADETARDVDHILRRRHSLACPGNVPAHAFFPPGPDVEEFRRFGSRVLARPMDVAGHVELPTVSVN